MIFGEKLEDQGKYMQCDVVYSKIKWGKKVLYAYD